MNGKEMYKKKSEEFNELISGNKYKFECGKFGIEFMDAKGTVLKSIIDFHSSTEKELDDFFLELKKYYKL